MLPLHRLAAQQQPSRGPVATAGFFLRNLGSSRLATRVFILLGASVFLVLVFSPPSVSDFRPSFSWLDDDRRPWSQGLDSSKHFPPPKDLDSFPPPLDPKTV